MKTIVVLLIVSCMAFVSSKEENFGLTYGRILGRHSVSAPAVNSQQQIRSFSYPDVSNCQKKCNGKSILMIFLLFF